MRSARTFALALVGVGGLLLACGHLPFEDIPNTEDAGGADGGPLEDGNLPDADLLDASVDARVDASVDAADGGCAGPTCVGTFVSGATGADTNPGTAGKPVKTIAKGMAIAVALGGQQNVYVAASHYPEKVTLVERIDLLGGYDCSAISCTWARDANKNDTAILDPDDEGVLAPATVTRKTLFDGFRVAGKSGVPNGAPGIAAMSLAGGTPTVMHCRLTGGAVTGGAPNATSIGLVVAGAPNDAAGALIEQNAISGGTSTDESIGVLFTSRVASVAGPSVAVLRSNKIRGGAASVTTGVSAFTSGLGTVIERNDIASGTSSAASGASWGIIVGSTMTIDANHINTDVNSGAACPTSAAGSFCGGIHSLGSTTTIVNNVVRGAKGPRTCAVLLTDGEEGLGTVVLNGNTLDGGGNAGPDGSVSAAVALRISQGMSATLGKVRNNILLGGSNKNRYGVFEDATAGKTARTVALENNDFWNVGVPRNDFAYRVWNGNAGTDVTFAQLGTIPAPVPSGNLGVDPLLDATYHLTVTSPMIDKGTSTEAPLDDLDGNSRPKGAAIDIGADEAK